MLKNIESKQDLSLENQQDIRDQVSNLHKLMEKIISSGYGSSGEAGPTTSPQNIWEINLKEIEFEYEEDDCGDRTKVALGKGGFGTVYKGQYRGEPVAVKAIGLMDPKTLDLAVKEAGILHTLQHPHIATCYGAHMGKKSAYLVMELLKCTLEYLVHVERRMIGLEEKIRFSKEMADGLNYLHNTKPRIIHRDFKLANVMLNHRDSVRRFNLYCFAVRYI